jgi:hypothetical protein
VCQEKSKQARPSGKPIRKITAPVNLVVCGQIAAHVRPTVLQVNPEPQPGGAPSTSELLLDLSLEDPGHDETEAVHMDTMPGEDLHEYSDTDEEGS